MSAKRLGVLVVVVLLAGMFSFLSIVPDNARAVTRYVGGGGPSNYTTIQEAIDAAFPGDTIYVYVGSYYEHVSVYKPLLLVGEDRGGTVVDGNGTGTVVNVSSDWVNITEMTITGGGETFGDAGLVLYGVENCSVTNITASRNGWYGVYLSNSSNNNLSNNEFSSNTYGAFLWSADLNRVAGNEIRWNEWQGLYVYYSENNTIVDNRVNVTGGNGIMLHFSNNSVVADNTAERGVAGRDVYGITLWQSTGNLIQHNTLRSNTEGIAISLSDDNVFDGNSLSNNGLGFNLKLSTNSTLTNNVMIEDGIFVVGDMVEYWNTHNIDISNTVNGNPVYYWKNAAGGSIPPNAGQVILANCTNVSVENQSINGTEVGIELGFSSFNRLANNSMSSNSYAGILTYYSDSNLLLGNTAYDNVRAMSLSHSRLNRVMNHTLTNNDYGIHLSGSQNSTITGNEVISSRTCGICLSSSPGNSIHDNIISDNEAGVWLSHSEQNTVTANDIVGNVDGVLVFHESWGSNIGNNTISLSKSNGIHVLDSGSNVLAHNDISWNNLSGIRVKSSSSNRIIRNRIANNAEGVLDPCKDEVYHNSFIDNAVQAVANLSTLISWDHGYPSGGNYWSDYAGTDDFRGIGQNISGSDGIGDSPYDIDALSRDRYPLMNPIGSVAYEPPTDLRASLGGIGRRDVIVTWTPSVDDGGGKGVVRSYEVYRGSVYHPNGSGYSLLATLPNSSYTYEDQLAGEGDPNCYYYIVCAVDFLGLRLCAENQAGKFTRSLSQGKILVSTPLIPSNLLIASVLGSAEYDQAWAYDSRAGEWAYHSQSKPYDGGLNLVNHTMGLWVDVTRESNLTVAGIIPYQATIQLRKGWNLVGFPSFNTTYTVAELRAETGATRVEGFDPSAPPYFLRVLGDGETLQAGYGYWVHVDRSTTWTVTAR